MNPYLIIEGIGNEYIDVITVLCYLNSRVEFYLDVIQYSR